MTNIRFGSFILKEKIVGTGLGSDQGRFQPLCASSPRAEKPGVCQLGRFLGKRANSNRNGGHRVFGA